MDYLEIYKKFNEVEEIKDYIDDVLKLRYYYNNQQYKELEYYIDYITKKYAVETSVWNMVNTIPPKTYEELYINAENFLKAQSAVIVVKSVANYERRLNVEEAMFIKSMAKPME